MMQLLAELRDFKQTSLYEHFRTHFANLFGVTVDQILDLELKGPETLYTREAWVGEARAARLQARWFDILGEELEVQVREKQKEP